MGSLVENLLAVTQLSESAPEAECAPLPAAVDAVIARLGGAAERVDVDIPAELPDASVDRRMLELVVGNLLDNALKFSPEASRCRIAARLEGREVFVWVEDDGIGIATEHLGRIFDRFHQVDSSSTRRHGGVWLGLHLVKTIIDHAGGAIEVHSEPGKGSRFAFRLPAAKSRVERQRALPQPARS